MKLGVNIDHVATVREARKIDEPDPVKAAEESESAGCDSIVCHLRKDRRHVKDEDLLRLKKVVQTSLNLEMSLDQEIVDIALEILPDQATLVPENRAEITTEGGLNVVKELDRTAEVVSKLRDRGVRASLFIDPEKEQVDASVTSGADMVEFHTGSYAEAKDPCERERELEKLREMVKYASTKELVVCAGHGLNYDNVREVAAVSGITELNIGHSIISRAVFVGIYNAVRQMKEILG